MIGQQLAHFRIIDLLGEGGMGAVYRAEDTKLGREVAIKVLPEAFVADPERLARFEREAKVLAALDHPNIAGIYEVGQEEEIHFLAMQLAPGKDLAQVLAEGSPPLETALSIALQIANALEAAHASGIVHRDLKPANVKVASDGSTGVAVKVLDFGLAKAWDGGSAADGSLSMSPTLTAQMTQVGVILGTAGYMSPEQARGQEADARADVWSFGVMLWEMVTGQRLFQEDTVSDTLAAVLKTQIDLGKLPEDLPPPIHRLISRCLERDVHSRLQAIGEARIAIEAYLADPDAEMTAATELAATEIPAASTLRRWAPVAITALAAGLIATLVTRQLQPEPVPPPLRRFTIDAEGSADDRWTQHAVISPDGTMIAYPGNDGIMVRSMDQLEPRQVDNTESANWVIWSPDSRHLAFQARDYNIYRLDLARGGRRLISESPGGRLVLSATWLADDIIIFSSQLGSVFQVATSGGEPQQVTDLSLETAFGVGQFRELPDGKGILCNTRTSAGQWSLVALRNGERIETGESLWLQAYSNSGHLLYSRGDDDITLWVAPFDPDELEFTAEPTLLAESADRVSLADDGTLLYSIPGDVSMQQIARVDRHGSILDTIAEPVANLELSTVSPDGRFILAEYQAKASDNNSIFVYDLERSVWTRLGTDEIDQGHPRWSADGQQIYFRDGSNIAMIRKDGVGGKQVLFPGHSPQPSHTGSVLLFMQGSTMMHVELGEDGFPRGDPTQVPGTPAEHTSRGGLSPDGRFLLYGSNESGELEVYLTEYPESRSRWQVSPNGGRDSRWAPDGKTIYYISRSTRAFSEVSFAVEDESPQLGNAIELFSGQEFGGSVRNGVWPIAAGGAFMVVANIGDDNSAIPRLVVVENALSELQ